MNFSRFSAVFGHQWLGEAQKFPPDAPVSERLVEEGPCPSWTGL
jgi:hypothetical protein